MTSPFSQFSRRMLPLSQNTFLRFLVAGGINTLFGYAIYCEASYAGAPVWLALLIGTVAGILFNFFTTAGYVFRQLTPSRFPRFVVCYVLVYAVNLVLIKFLSFWFEDDKLRQLILVGPMAILSYLLMARFVFTGKKS